MGGPIDRRLFRGRPRPEAAEPPLFELKIRFQSGRPVSVEGPIADRMLCYGMLEMARDAVREYNPKSVESPGEPELPDAKESP